MDNKSKTMPVTEFCKRLGILNPESFRKGMREAAKANKPFFMGYAYHTGKEWRYIIPREPAEFFLTHGRLPDSEVYLQKEY